MRRMRIKIIFMNTVSLAGLEYSLLFLALEITDDLAQKNTTDN